MSTTWLKSKFRSKNAQTADPEGTGTELTLVGPIDLPAELQLLVFETTAQRYLSTIPTLLCLSRSINNYLNAVIYKTVNLLLFPRIPSKPSIDKKNWHQPPVTTWAPWVQNLLVGGIPLSPNHETDILSLIASRSSSHSPPLINLAIWSPTPTHTLLPHITSLHIQRLSTSFSSLSLSDLQPTSNPNPDWKTHITHLDLTSYLNPPRTTSTTPATSNHDQIQPIRNKKWSDLPPAFPSLTHLAINEPITLSNIHVLLTSTHTGTGSDRKPLEVLILIKPERGDAAPWNTILHPPAPSPTTENTIKDPRLVLLSMYRYHPAEWQAGVQGLEDFWSVAENVVAAKLAGDFQGAEYTWISRQQWCLDLNALRLQRQNQSHTLSATSSS